MALTATDYTVTIENKNIQNKQRVNRVKLVLASGTYPSNGIPAPTANQLGMVRNIDYVMLIDPDATAYVVKYDKDNHSFRIFSLSSDGGAELATTATVGSTVLQTFYVEAKGW